MWPWATPPSASFCKMRSLGDPGPFRPSTDTQVPSPQLVRLGVVRNQQVPAPLGLFLRGFVPQSPSGIAAMESNPTSTWCNNHGQIPRGAHPAFVSQADLSTHMLEAQDEGRPRGGLPWSRTRQGPAPRWPDGCWAEALCLGCSHRLVPHRSIP